MTLSRLTTVYDDGQVIGRELEVDPDATDEERATAIARATADVVADEARKALRERLGRDAPGLDATVEAVRRRIFAFVQLRDTYEARHPDTILVYEDVRDWNARHPG